MVVQPVGDIHFLVARQTQNVRLPHIETSVVRGGDWIVLQRVAQLFGASHSAWNHRVGEEGSITCHRIKIKLGISSVW